MRSSSGQETSTSMQQFNQNPFAQPFKNDVSKKPKNAGEVEESKGQPAGVAVDDRAHPMRLLVLADDHASFFKLQQEGTNTQLVQDTTLPNYPQAKLARFAPLAGKQASIVDELGIHVVSMDTCQETLFIALEHIDSLRYSPADNFVVACEKFNQNTPDYPNLHIMDTKTGRAVAEWVWRKPAKEALKTLKWSPDESICLRMAPPEAPNQPNQIEIYRDSNFSQPAGRI